jgi:hypothetical protein
MLDTHYTHNHTSIPDQMATEAEKFRKEWYIPMADYVINLCTRNDFNHPEITKLLNLANGYIPESEFEAVTKLYGEDKDDLNKLKIRNIDFMAEIKDKYMGEFSKSYYYYQAYSLDSDSISYMNKEIEHNVQSMAMQELINILNAQEEQRKQQQAAEQASYQEAMKQTGGDEEAAQEIQEPPVQQPPLATGKESKPIEDIDAWVKEYKVNWKDDRVVKAQQRLELVNQILNVKDKYYTAFYYWWCTESCYTYREIIDGQLYFWAVSPLEYYRCHSGNKYVEDDDYGCWKQYVSIQGLVDLCRHYFSEKELKAIIELCKYCSPSGEVNVPVVKYRECKMFLDLPDDNLPGVIKDNNGNIRLWNTSNRIEVWRYAYKTPVRHKRLMYMDITGEIKEKIVLDDYELDEAAGDISIHNEWINKCVVGLRIGNYNNGFYSKPKYAECQRELYGNESVCKLPFNGVSYIINENARNPIPKRLEDYIKLYRIITAQMERAINMFKDMLIFPESTLLDSTELTAAQRLNRSKLDSLFPVNDSNLETLQILQHIREVYTQGIEKYVSVLSQLREQVRNEALRVVNFNEAREGQLGQYAGKATTEYALNIAQTGTAWMLEQFNLFREKDMEANYDWSKVAWIDGIKGSYIDPTTGEVVYVSLDEMEGLIDNIGISIMHNAQLEEQTAQLKQYAFNMGQNGNEIVAIESITNRNISKLKQLIKEAGDKNREFQLDMQRASEEARQQTEQVIAQAKQEELAMEMKMLQMKLESETEKAIAVAEIHRQEMLEVTAMKIESGMEDSDGNGSFDNYRKKEIEEEKVSSKNSLDREKLNATREKNYMDYAINLERNKIAKQKAKTGTKN